MRSLNPLWIIWVSFIPALVLTLIPLPDFFAYARPQWSVLFVVFWIIRQPEKAGLWTAWFVGFMMDILTGVLLGQHSLALLLASFIVLWLRKRMLRATILEQVFLLIPVFLVFQITYLWVGTALGRLTPTFLYLLSIASSIVFWPVVSFLLRKLCEIYVVKET